MIVANQIYYFYGAEGVAPPVEPPAAIGSPVDSRMHWRRTNVRLTSIEGEAKIASLRISASARVTLQALTGTPTLGNLVLRGATTVGISSLTTVPSLSRGVFRAGAKTRLSSFEALIAQGQLKVRGDVHISARHRGKSFSIAPLLGKPRITIGPDAVKVADEELLDLLLFME